MVAVHTDHDRSSIEIILADVNDIIRLAKRMKRVQFIDGKPRVQYRQNLVTQEYKVARDALRKTGRLNLYVMKCKELHPTNDVDTYYAASNAILSVLVRGTVSEPIRNSLSTGWKKMLQASNGQV